MIQTRKDAFRLDAPESAFFKRQLEYVKARTYDIKYKDLKATLFIPVSSEAPSGATEITYRQYTKYGLAKIIADYAHDFPRVELLGEEFSVKIKDLGASYDYNIKEIRKAMLAGVDITSKKAAIARRAIEELINKLAWFGDTTHNVQGLLNYPGITEFTIPATGTGASKLWSTKTPDQILVDLNGIRDAITVPTAGKEMPTRLLLPLAKLNLLKNTRVGSTSDKTIYQFWTENNPGIALDWLQELEGYGAGGTDRMIAYPQDDMHLTLEIPVLFEQLEEQHEGMTYVIPVHAECAGVIVYYPQSVAFADGF